MKKKDLLTTNNMAKMAMLIALSVIGASIKIQGSIAFDSMPAFFAALYIGPLAGALVGFLGHLVSSGLSSFPLTLPVHLVIAVQMFVFIYIFGKAYRYINKFLAVLLGVFLNGVVGTLIIVPISIYFGLPFNGWPLFYALIIPLSIAAFLNILIGTLVFERLNRRI